MTKHHYNYNKNSELGRTNVTDDRRQTDGWQHIIVNVNVSSRSLKLYSVTIQWRWFVQFRGWNSSEANSRGRRRAGPHFEPIGPSFSGPDLRL